LPLIGQACSWHNDGGTLVHLFIIFEFTEICVAQEIIFLQNFNFSAQVGQGIITTILVELKIWRPFPDYLAKWGTNFSSGYTPGALL